jgi:hypothetical protein
MLYILHQVKAEEISQAPLQIPRTLQSNDLVNSLAIYEITFITSTTGTIDKIEMIFPAGTNTAPAGVIERVGIVGGTLIKSVPIPENSVTYDVTTPISVPAGTFIRLGMFGIKNPATPSTSSTATITTRDSGGNAIDGPSVTNVYAIKQIGSNELADNGITPTKPNEGFMKRVTLLDNGDGHGLGWNPDGITTDFNITLEFLALQSTFVSVSLDNGDNVCGVDDYGFVGNGADGPIPVFRVKCTTAPPDGAELHYIRVNLPPHVNTN